MPATLPYTFRGRKTRTRYHEAMLSNDLPLFPLPNIVLFPGVFLPLHVFEMRYRAMVEDVLAGSRMIGISLLKPGWHQDDQGQLSIFGIGCAGLVTHVEKLDDGRYNLVLRGVEKFRVTAEREQRQYRVARVEYVTEMMSDAEHAAVRGRRQQLEKLLASADTPDLPFSSTLSDEEIVNALAQYLDFDPIERQALLEREGVVARCDALIDLLEMKSMIDGHHQDRGVRH